VIHLGTHARLVVDNKCIKSFYEMKNVVEYEVCCMPSATTLAIVFSTNKIFISRHLFNKDGEGLVEVFNNEKLNQTLLKFVHSCSPRIHNLIASLNIVLVTQASLIVS
jgi:hypothetical protein